MTLQDVIDKNKLSRKLEIKHTLANKCTTCTGIDAKGKAFYESVSMQTFRAMKRRYMLLDVTDKKYSAIKTYLVKG